MLNPLSVSERGHKVRFGIYLRSSAVSSGRCEWRDPDSDPAEAGPTLRSHRGRNPRTDPSFFRWVDREMLRGCPRRRIRPLAETMPARRQHVGKRSSDGRCFGYRCGPKESCPSIARRTARGYRLHRGSICVHADRQWIRRLDAFLVVARPRCGPLSLSRMNSVLVASPALSTASIRRRPSGGPVRRWWRSTAAGTGSMSSVDTSSSARA